MVEETERVVRSMLAIGIHRDCARSAVSAGVVETRAQGGPFALICGVSEDDRPMRACDLRGPIRGAVIDDHDRRQRPAPGGGLFEVLEDSRELLLRIERGDDDEGGRVHERRSSSYPKLTEIRCRKDGEVPVRRF